MKNLPATKSKNYFDGLTQKEKAKAKQLLDLAINDDSVMETIDELADIPVKKVTICEFLLEYDYCIKDSKCFEENFCNISFQHLFGESIDSIVNAYFNTNAINSSQLSALKTALEKIIRSYRECQFKFMEANLLL